MHAPHVLHQSGFHRAFHHIQFFLLLRAMPLRQSHLDLGHPVAATFWASASRAIPVLTFNNVKNLAYLFFRKTRKKKEKKRKEKKRKRHKEKKINRKKEKNA